MRGEQIKAKGQDQRQTGTLIIRTYWRDNAHPFPGLLISTKVVKATAAKQARQKSFEKSFLHLDHTLVADGRGLEPSDNGRSAAEIRDACEEVPRWQLLWKRARGRLTRKQKRILDALLAGLGTTAAARKARVDRKSILRFKKTFFKMHFDQCHTAWKRDFAQ